MKASTLALGCIIFACLAVSAHTSLATTATPELVTLKLDDFQDLFRKAHLSDEERRFRVRTEELEAAYQRKQKDLEVDKKALQQAAERRASRRDELLQSNWLLVNHSASGSYRLPRPGDLDQQGLAAFDFCLEFHIFEDGWTAIPIIDSQVIVGDWDISKKVNARDSASLDDPIWVRQPFDSELLLMLRKRASSDKDAADAQFYDHTLLTNRSGAYRVQFRAHSHVQNTRNLHGLSLSLAYPLSIASFTLEHPEADGADRGAVREFSVEPAAFHSLVEHGNRTEVQMLLPSTKALELKWRSVAAEAAPRRGPKNGTQAAPAASPEGEDLGAQATVQHDALLSIGDGVLQSSSSFKFSFDAEQPLSVVEVLVFGGARVTGVVAHGMQTWRAAPVNVSAEEAGDGPAGNATLVQVFFKTSTMAREAIVLLTTESAFDAEGGRVELPVMVCRKVLRQVGTLAVVKAANAEVYESALRGAARASLGDIPMSVRSRTDRPIVLAYKYLAPRYSVELTALQHEEVPTLDAVVDSALYQVLVADTQRMHKLTMVVQNSQQQYMVVRDIPGASAVWSLRVNSLSTRPARGRDGGLLIPLLVGTGGDSNEGGVAPLASVELAWTTEQPPLGENGSLALSPPRVELPITALSVEVQLPEAYLFNFTGSLQNVSIFSHKQPRAVNYQTDRHVVEDGFKFGAPPPAAEEKASVKAAIPKQGKRYRFEKILIVGDSAVLNATYSLRPSPSTGSKSWSWPSFF